MLLLDGMTIFYEEAGKEELTFIQNGIFGEV